MQVELDQSTADIIVGLLALFGVLYGFLVTIYTAYITRQKDLAIAKSTREKDLAVAKLTREKDLEIAEMRVSQELSIEYDKNLREHRITHYQSLLEIMLLLPKYPEPKLLTYDEARKQLADNFTNWYFTGGGLYMSAETRDKYFDLQDGLKIVLQKKQAQEKEEIGSALSMAISASLASCFVKDNFLDLPNLGEQKLSKDKKLKAEEKLRNHLHRPPRWSPSEHLMFLALSDVPEDEQIPADDVERLRRLGSSLRTSMTQDLLTRQGSYFTEFAMQRAG